MPANRTIKLLLVEDQLLVCERLKCLLALSAYIAIVGEASHVGRVETRDGSDGGTPQWA